MANEDGVRATNDDATQCKWFAVERGYWKDPYLTMFAQRGQQTHAPEISIGYYARVQGLRILLNKFLSPCHPQRNLEEKPRQQSGTRQTYRPCSWKVTRTRMVITVLKSYAARKMGIDDVGLEIRGELTKFELKLLLRQQMVVIRGKTGKGVPVILPADVKEALQFLSDPEVRRKSGIQQSNPYVFANAGAGVFRAYDAIRSVTSDPSVQLQLPNLIRTSNMRKYMATMLQALNTTENERQWILDHLGHTMNVHQVHYRQTSDVLERVDVSKVLLIQDLGMVGKFRGKNLQDIQLDDPDEIAQMSTPQDLHSSLTSCACQVVSLGAGYDTTYWNLKDQNLAPASYIEVDFASVTSKKIHYIRRGKALLEKISNEDGEIQFSPTDLHGQDYHLVSANLKNISELDKKLKDCGIDRTLPTIFLAECVLIYIEKQKTDEIVRWIADNFLTAFFINYEQVNMGDRFGQIMQDNLRGRDCMLHTEACSSLESQMQRFTSNGWEGSDAMEMRHVLGSLPQADVQRVEKISLLDERELLDQLMSHYCYCWAYKDPGKIGLADISMY